MNDPTAPVERADPRLVHELGERICQTLGVDPTRTVHVVIEWEPQRLPRAIVTMLLSEGTVRELMNLTPRDRETMVGEP